MGASIPAILGPGTAFTQTCWVVDDVDPAMAGWLALGVGPFFVLDCHFEDALYRGKPMPLHYRIALAQAGAMQVELIQTLSDHPSSFRDVAPQGGTALHHMCKFTEDYAGDVAALEAAGIAIANAFVAGDMPVCYADTRAQIGCMLEILTPRQPILDLYALVKAAAEDWDGSDSIRHLK